MPVDYNIRVKIQKMSGIALSRAFNGQISGNMDSVSAECTTYNVHLFLFRRASVVEADMMTEGQHLRPDVRGFKRETDRSRDIKPEHRIK